MRTLAKDFYDEFLPNDRNRGETYFQANRVVGLSNDGVEFTAVVVGSSNHNVVVAAESSQFVDMHCDCPRFASAGSCKHLWATLLAIEAREWPESGPEKNGPERGPVSGETGLSISKATRADELLRQFKDATCVGAGYKKAPDQLLESTRRYLFVLEIAELPTLSDLSFSTYCVSRKRNGEEGVSQLVSWNSDDPYRNQDISPAVTRILRQCVGDREIRGGYAYTDNRWSVPLLVHDSVFSELTRVGDLVWTCGDGALSERDPITWDNGPPHVVELELRRISDNEFRIDFTITREGMLVPVVDVVRAFNDGLILFQDRLARLELGHAAWVHLAKKSALTKPLFLKASEVCDFVSGFAQLSTTPLLRIDEECDVPQVLGRPRGSLLLEWCESDELSATVEMEYGKCRVDPGDERDLLYDADWGALIRRDRDEEKRLLSELTEIPLSTTYGNVASGRVRLAAKHLLPAVERLNALGWEVRAEGKPIRSGGSFPTLTVDSNQDWFDVSVQFDFDGTQVRMPALLQSLRRNQKTVVLDDGSIGILPEEWLQQHGKLAEFGEATDDGIRFHRSQAFVLDSLLADLDVKKDIDYQRLVQQLKRFEGVKPAKQPRTFKGELRPYQASGLGWLRFLKDFGFGGCLADDMGLGKTIQVLAMLEHQRIRRLPKQSDAPEDQRRPSLVVVPKSLIFNWIDEAARFTPRLKMLDYTGNQRKEKRRQIADYHVVVTTYGTLRRDIQHLRDVEFDYVVLDEAQAIKNPASQSAKSCLLLNGANRLAMTGTPVENQLGDLWSIFEFLNPGMLGKLPAFQKFSGGFEKNEANLTLIRDAIAPFILRRTKEEVLTDLPSKTEQTLLVDLHPKQQKLYDELREYYRSQLTQQVAKTGLNGSKMHILEALMRMRQVACDPRLLDPNSPIKGTKVEMLGEQMESIVQDGHKALVFSQFTSLLALAKPQLTRRNIAFEYLDGKTTNRRECVRRFQENDDLSAFLISLKAGGHGLNLTAADYVFILDPWWNPAAEAQAVDRAHRIGQTKPVVAYRMIAKGTIEEKIMELKKRKQRLAESIVTANSSVMKDLTADDLAELFS